MLAARCRVLRGAVPAAGKRLLLGTRTGVHVNLETACLRRGVGSTARTSHHGSMHRYPPLTGLASVKTLAPAPVRAHAFSTRFSLNQRLRGPAGEDANTPALGALAVAAGGLFLGGLISQTDEGNLASFAHCGFDSPKYFKSAKLFTGNANPDLAQEIAEEIGVSLGRATVSRFADGEVNVMIHENVRGQDIYIIQPTSPPTNENLMELLLLISSMRRSSARRITAVIPYYGYARQDRKMTSRVPISAADCARLLEAMGVDRVIAVDLHCGQIQGFFGPRVPVDNLDGAPVGVEYFAENVKLVNPVVVSPDAGGVYRAKQFRDRLDSFYGIDAGVAMIIKQRRKAGVIGQMDLVGSVENADVIIVDDMIDTAGTLCKAAEQIKKFGARRVFAFASHGLFSGPADERIRNSVLEKVVVVNSIPLKEATAENPKIMQLSIAPLLSAAIKAVQSRTSVSTLFKKTPTGKKGGGD